MNDENYIETYHGNIWDLVPDSSTPTLAVIPTNIGWRKGSGDAVMGAGLAAQAAKRYPNLAGWYGGYCRILRGRAKPVRHPRYPVIFFPTKPLNEDQPHLSWKNAADETLVRWSFEGLRHIAAHELRLYRIAVPLVGAGLGGLDPDLIRSLRSQYLTEPNFIFVDDR